jgi:hypothetical protein
MIGTQSRSGRFGKKPLWLMPGIESRFLCHSVQIVFTVPTELSWLQHISYNGGQTAAILFYKGKIKVHIKKACRLKWGLAPLIFKICTRWSRVVSLTTQFFALGECALCCPLRRKPVWATDIVDIFRAEKNLVPLPVSEQRAFQSAAQSLS